MAVFATPASAVALAALLAACSVATLLADKQINWAGANWAMSCDFADGDFQKLLIPGEKCGPVCDATPGCTHFSWKITNGGTCALKNGTVGKSAAFSIDDKTAVCGVSTNPVDRSSSGSILWRGNWAPGCDFPTGVILKESRVSGEVCGPTCDATAGCTHFIWSQGVCRMKSGPAAKENAVPISDPTTVCGVAATPPSVAPTGTLAPTSFINWKPGNQGTGCDLPGIDYKVRQPLSSDKCATKCDSDTRCTHYTWTASNGGTCRLKIGGATRGDAFASVDATAACGLSTARQKLLLLAETCLRQGNGILNPDPPESPEEAEPVQQCRQRCASKPDCTHFVWTDADGRCSLMKGGTQEADGSIRFVML